MFDKSIMNIQGAKRVLALAFAFAFIRALLTCSMSIGLSVAIVGVWEGGAAALEAQVPWIALFFLSLTLRQLAAACEQKILDAFAGNTCDSLLETLLRSVFTSGNLQGGNSVSSAAADAVADTPSANSSAAVAANAIEGISNIENYLTLIVPKTASAIAVPAVLLLAMFALDWVSGVIALVCYPFIMLFMRLIGSTAGETAEKRHAEFERMATQFTDTSAGVQTLAAFGAAEAKAESVFETSESFREITMKTLRIAMLSSTVLDIFATMGLAAVAIMLGFRLVEGTITFLPALAVLVMVPEYFKPIKELGNDYHASLDGRVAMQAINNFAAEQGPAQTNENAWPESISEVRISTAPQKIGVVGPSGSGKTTLLNVISGFAEAPEGISLLLNGESTRTLCTPEWQRRVAYIPQSPYMFHATLKENLSFYSPKATEEQILEAAEAAGLKPLSESLPEGMNTQIGEGSGHALSGGEAQRVAVCRALLDPARDIWVLDEPTAHLDAETEEELMESILPLMEGKTVFVATHRPYVESKMDVIWQVSN